MKVLVEPRPSSSSAPPSSASAGIRSSTRSRPDVRQGFLHRDAARRPYPPDRVELLPTMLGSLSRSNETRHAPSAKRLRVIHSRHVPPALAPAPPSSPASRMTEDVAHALAYPGPVEAADACQIMGVQAFISARSSSASTDPDQVPTATQRLPARGARI